MFVLLIVLAMLAMFRFARLVTADKISEKARDRLAGVTRDESGEIVDVGRPMIAYFVTCPWCVSMYPSIPAAIVIVYWPDLRPLWVVVITLALSAAAGLLSSVEAMLDRVWPEPAAEE